MAPLAGFTALYPIMAPELPGCPDNFMLQAIKKAYRSFCQDTDGWRQQLPSINIKDGVLDYLLTPVAPGADCAIKHVVEVRMGSEKVDLAGADVVTTVAAGLSTINVHGIASASGTIASGSEFVFEGGDGTLYTLSAAATITSHTATLLFTPVLSEEATAGDELAVIPPGDLGTLIRPELYTFHAEATTRLDVAQNLNILSLHTSLTPAEDLLRGLDVKVSLVPHVASDSVDLNFLTRWAEAIVGGAVSYLMTMKGRKWTDTGRAPLLQLDYNAGKSRLRKETIVEYKSEFGEISA